MYPASYRTDFANSAPLVVLAELTQFTEEVHAHQHLKLYTCLCLSIVQTPMQTPCSDRLVLAIGSNPKYIIAAMKPLNFYQLLKVQKIGLWYP